MTRDITRELADELHGFEVGMANFFIQHTSASLTINENASPDVPLDLNVSAALTTMKCQPLSVCLMQSIILDGAQLLIGMGCLLLSVNSDFRQVAHRETGLHH